MQTVQKALLIWNMHAPVQRAERLCAKAAPQFLFRYCSAPFLQSVDPLCIWITSKHAILIYHITVKICGSIADLYAVYAAGSVLLIKQDQLPAACLSFIQTDSAFPASMIYSTEMKVVSLLQASERIWSFWYDPVLILHV